MYTRTPKELALLVMNQRKKLGLSQTDLGMRVGLKQKTISAFENKPENTKLTTLFQILSAVRIDMHLYTKEESKKVGKQGWKEEW